MKLWDLKLGSLWAEMNMLGALDRAFHEKAILYIGIVYFF